MVVSLFHTALKAPLSKRKECRALRSSSFTGQCFSTNLYSYPARGAAGCQQGQSDPGNEAPPAAMPYRISALPEQLWDFSKLIWGQLSLGLAGLGAVTQPGAAGSELTARHAAPPTALLPSNQVCPAAPQPSIISSLP